MKRGIIIIIIGVLLLVITGIVWAAFQMGFIGPPKESAEPGDTPPAVSVPDFLAPDEESTPIPELTQIVVAVQDIPRGWEITQDVVTLWDWPVDALPPDAIIGAQTQDYNNDGVPDAIEQVIGQRMRTNAVRFEPILATMLADRIDLTGTGSDAALSIPSGRVLIAYPLPDIEHDPTAAVAYALRPGDHVDLMLSLALVDLDEEFHTKLPNKTQVLEMSEATEEEGGERKLTLTEFPYGRIEEGPLGLIFNVIPGEDEQRPRLVTQLTVQDAVVVRIGRYPTYEEEIRGIDPQAPPTPTPVPEDTEQEGPPPPPPPPPKPEVIVLAVTPQEALVIKFAREINARVDFAVRAVGDQALFQTNAVTLQYLMETYGIAVPPKLQYGIEPPIYQVESLIEETSGGD